MSTEADSKMAAVEKGDKAEGTKRRNKPDKSSTIEEEKGEKLESEDEDEEEEEEERVGLLERSPIVEGKREKKKVERLTLQVTPSAKETFSIPEGRGTKLGEIERIQYFMGKTKAEDLKSLHKILYNRPGSLATLKRNIRLFAGFSFETGSEQHKKKEEVLKKNPISVLKVICTVLDLERKGTKDEIVSKILNFLMKPKASGKSLPKPKKKRQKGGKKDHSSSGSKKKSKAATSEEILTDESSSEEEKKKEKYSDESDAEEEVEPPKKASKKEKSTSKAVPKGKKGQNTKATNVKKADSSTAKKTPAPAKKDMGSGVKKVASIGRLAETKLNRAMSAESESEDSSDDEPLIKKLKKPPTDEELKETVMKLLVDANLEEVTMKQICKKVFASYPDYDLSDKKDFVKNTVKELIS
ncbi:protein DEK isoform X1 [Chiloscyllium plagiosum]|uniref:protein DEK isoform X1 n=2 Tax=Chiloscyllium plagiosum TaxID=36176 RepID=UPI001CB805D6|nr:protein DEK isoform X1 [Chiloscyllium plagiosum]